MKKMLMALVATSVLLGGCATVIDGASQPVTFKSNPEGVEIYRVNGARLGVTPFTAQMARDGDHQFVAKKEGYKAQVVKLAFKKNNTTHANALSPMTFAVGDMVDTFSGAQFDLEPEVNFTMKPAK